MPTFAVMADMDRKVDPRVPRPFPESHMSCETRITAAVLGKGARRHLTFHTEETEAVTSLCLFCLRETSATNSLWISFFQF